ncbi:MULTISPECIES: regulatory protein RecX [Limnochorda]|uniref:regulatory protein RecX n=1 Tax=Limnochorda TaxID=1676651 RepID=UPI001D816E8D|nr:regulatory protein RecX [Limnochorda pilosa]MBO2486012.1 hypothetical protein [Bacillota bacterium]MBO2518822.1 hypothetical protein [Bacillota bacterium]
MKPQSERTIASMEPAGRGPAGSRVRIGFDDGSSLELPHELAIGLGWHPGDRVSDREVERARRRGEAVEAREHALRLLEYQARTRSELRHRLERAGYRPPAVRFALHWCAARGFLDDRRFAEAWLASRLTRPEYGSYRLRHELIQRGINPALAQELVEAALPPETELERAVEAARRYWRRKGKAETLSPQEALKLSRYLAGRGFPYATVREAVRQLGGELLPEETP